MHKTFIVILLTSMILFSNLASADYGFEFESITYLNKGYHGSAWYGKNGKRVRLIYASVTYPEMLNPDGFKNYTSTFKEIEFDFYFGEDKDNFREIWFAAGAGQTDMSVESKSTGKTATITSTDFHTGVGYAISVKNNFYINPWIGADVHLDAPKTVNVGSEIWQPQIIEIVGGMKLGFDF